MVVLDLPAKGNREVMEYQLEMEQFAGIPTPVS